MRLQRKPRKGDLIGFGMFKSSGSASTIIVEPKHATYIVTRTPEGNPEHDGNADRLCWIQRLDRDGKPYGEASPFIWFHWVSGKPEGRNLLARIFDASGTIEASLLGKVEDVAKRFDSITLPQLMSGTAS